MSLTIAWADRRRSILRIQYGAVWSFRELDTMFHAVQQIVGEATGSVAIISEHLGTPFMPPDLAGHVKGMPVLTDPKVELSVIVGSFAVFDLLRLQLPAHIPGNRLSYAESFRLARQVVYLWRRRTRYAVQRVPVIN
jgi:hypothetical protein